MTYRLLVDSLPDCARQLGRAGAQARQDKAREARRAFHRKLRARLGLPEAEALR